jgi:hypothetical protein
MDLDKGMAEQVAAEMPSAAEIAANRWLPDADLRVYTEEYGRTGFQGGLNGYRGSPGNVDLQIFAGRTIDVPSTFMGGKSDWGVYQNPGALDRLEKTVTTKYRGTHLVDGAGHWVQQEQPAVISRLLIDFLKPVVGKGRGLPTGKTRIDPRAARRRRMRTISVPSALWSLPIAAPRLRARPLEKRSCCRRRRAACVRPPCADSMV